MAITRRPANDGRHLVGQPIDGDELTALEARDSWDSIKSTAGTFEQSGLVLCSRVAEFYDRKGPKAMGWEREDGSPVPMMAAILKVTRMRIYQMINAGRAQAVLVNHGLQTRGLTERTLREAVPLLSEPETLVQVAADAQEASQVKAEQNAARVKKKAPRKVAIDPKIFRQVVKDSLPKKPPESMGERRIRALNMMVSGLDRCSGGCAMVGGDEVLSSLLDECRGRVEALSKQ
jgi:hypothetical protein